MTSDAATFQWSDLTDDQRRILDENWNGAKDMLSHLMALHDGTVMPHFAVLSEEEAAQYRLLDTAQLQLVLRAAVVSLCGATAYIAELVGEDQLAAMSKLVEE